MANIFEQFLDDVSDVVEDAGDFIMEAVGEVVSWFVDIPDIPDQNRDILINKQSNIAPIPVVYGRRKVGGTRVAVALSDDKKDLYVVLALCEGEIEDIESIYIDDIISTDSRFTGKVTINEFLGTDTQAADSMLTTAFPSDWTSNHRLRGIAYLSCKFVYDPEVFRGIPTVNAVIKGRKVYDPRTTNTVYNDNPALCLLDYLTNSRYGKGLSLSDIDTQSFADAADDCDIAVTKYTGAPSNTEIFNCNAVIDTNKTIFDNVKTMLSGMRGLLPYQNGKYGLIIEQDSSSVMSFDTDNMIGNVTFSVLGKDKRYNKVTAKFINPDANWQTDSVVWPESGSSDESTFLTEDDDFELATEITLPTCTDFYAARDLARLVCLTSRKNNLVVSFTADSEALKVQAGDIIDLTYDSANLSAQKFRANEVSLRPDGSVGISAQKHDATIYPWATYAIYDSLSDLGNVDVYGIIDPPSNLSISSALTTQPSNVQEVAWQVSWDASDAINLSMYEVAFKKTSDSVYASFFTTETSWSGVGGVVSGDSYDVRIKAVLNNGSKSSSLTGTHTMSSGMSTKLSAGEAASDINTNSTTISGGKITTGTVSADRIQSNTTVTANSTTFGLGTSTSFESIQSGGQFVSSSSSYYGLIVANTNTSGSAFAAGTRSTNSDKWAIVAGSGANSSFTTFSNVAGICDGDKAGLFADISGYSGSTPSFNSQIWLGYGTAAAYLWAGSYQPFTGSHDGLYDNTVSLPDLGDILVDTSVVTKKDINNTLTKVARSSSPNQKTVIGVYSGYKDASKPIAGLSEPVSLESGGTTMQTEAQYQSLLDDYDPISINALGEGLINVCNEGGDIAAGDLIVTSTMAGKGMKQSDDIVRSMTVAKARESATFSSDTEIKQIACIYLCG